MIRPQDVISPRYRALQLELHARPEGYGDRGDRWAPAVAGLIARFQASSVLDYGCGQGALIAALGPMVDGVRFAEYDPAVPGKDTWPDFADLVVVTDVLEHVEPTHLTGVLTHLKTLRRRAVFAVVSTREAARTLADGRNAHLIVQSAAWWLQTFIAAGFQTLPGPPSTHQKPVRELSVILT